MRELFIFAFGFLAAWLLTALRSDNNRPIKTGLRNITGPLLLTWDQCDEFFWPRGNAPAWGCVCRMRPIDIANASYDFRTDGPQVPPGITLRAMRTKGSGLYSLREASRDDNVFTLEAFVLQRHSGADSVSALVDGKHSKPFRTELALNNHGLELQNCPGGGSNLHYFEGLAEMVNHDYNATTTVCSEIFEVDYESRQVLRYVLQLCATRDLKAGWELTHDYREWGPTGAINRGKPNTKAWVEDMLRRSPIGGRRRTMRRRRRVL